MARYKIVEKENGELWWETAAVLGRVASGKCFIRGNILFITAGEPDEPGPLKREFLANLNGLLKWEKTEYYCSSYTMRTCETAETPPAENTGERSNEHKERAPKALPTKAAPSGRSKSTHATEGSDKFKSLLNWSSKLIVSMVVLVLFTFVGALSFVDFADHDEHKEKKRIVISLE